MEKNDNILHIYETNNASEEEYSTEIEEINRSADKNNNKESHDINQTSCISLGGTMDIPYEDYFLLKYDYKEVLSKIPWSGGYKLSSAYNPRVDSDYVMSIYKASQKKLEGNSVQFATYVINKAVINKNNVHFLARFDTSEDSNRHETKVLGAIPCEQKPIKHTKHAEVRIIENLKANIEKLSPINTIHFVMHYLPCIFCTDNHIIPFLDLLKDGYPNIEVYFCYKKEYTMYTQFGKEIRREKDFKAFKSLKDKYKSVQIYEIN